MCPVHDQAPRTLSLMVLPPHVKLFKNADAQAQPLCQNVSISEVGSLKHKSIMYSCVQLMAIIWRGPADMCGCQKLHSISPVWSGFSLCLRPLLFGLSHKVKLQM